MKLADLRQQYHRRLCDQIIRQRQSKKYNEQCPNFADVSNRSSIDISWGIVRRLGYDVNSDVIKGQTSGGRFEVVTKDFLEAAFETLRHLRPGQWEYSTSLAISSFHQYEHLAALENIIEENKQLASSLGTDYIVKPDIVVGRRPVSDSEVNQAGMVVDSADVVATLTPLRLSNSPTPRPILHASISCKWTLRSDRAQNARTEALNLIRNRKGNLPHVVAVTAEPLPTRIASLALGTGDMDCVYHFALHELREAILETRNEDQQDMLETLIDGRRLRDISDLPFDLAA